MIIDSIEKYRKWNTGRNDLKEKGQRFVDTAGDDKEWEQMGLNFKKLARYV